MPVIYELGTASDPQVHLTVGTYWAAPANSAAYAYTYAVDHLLSGVPFTVIPTAQINTSNAGRLLTVTLKGYLVP